MRQRRRRDVDAGEGGTGNGQPLRDQTGGGPGR
jgi:hypothetical protein